MKGEGAGMVRPTTLQSVFFVLGRLRLLLLRCALPLHSL